MKKLLSLLGLVSLTTTTTSSVVACQQPNTKLKTNKNEKNDLDIIITKNDSDPIYLGQLSVNTKANFLEKLQEKLKLIKDLTAIKTSYYDVYKAGTETPIQDSDITTNTFLNIRLLAILTFIIKIFL